MSRTNCLAQPVRLTRILAAVIAGLFLSLPAAWAGSYTVYVPTPNGIDDTRSLQSALDTCAARAADCVVQLAAGNYLTTQLVAYNFHGTFKGRGKARTTVEALPELTVNWPCAGLGWPNTTDCLWPTLIMFVDGDIRVSDLTLKITAVPATKPWSMDGWQLTALIDPLRFMGQKRTVAIVERIAVEGREDASDTSFWGYNLANGVTFSGELPKSPEPQDFYPFYGTLSVSSSSFRTSASGVYPSLLQDGRITVGGAPSRGNVFENVVAGVDLESIENSVVEVSHNLATGYSAGMWVIPWWGISPARPSLFLIHHNTFRPTGPYADGIYLQDDPANHWIYAAIYNNTIDAQDIGYGGISVYSTKGTTVWNNTVTGQGTDAIGIWDSSYAAVLGNNVTDFAASPDYAQIVLDETTSQSTVACKNPNDTVMNLGAGNKVVGCQQPEQSAAASPMSWKASKTPHAVGAIDRKPWSRPGKWRRSPSSN